uniref:netrin-1-like n=1 Tax=Myxine glutinosa TaxID=7769 RepID=UPI00358E4512
MSTCSSSTNYKPRESTCSSSTNCKLQLVPHHVPRKGGLHDGDPPPLDTHGGLSCYDDLQNPRLCAPVLGNVAFGRPVTASSTCDDPSKSLCHWKKVVGSTTPTKENVDDETERVMVCSPCDANDPMKSHPAAYLTDAHNPYAETWWQSALDDDDVSLSLSFAKRFEISSVSLKFIFTLLENIRYNSQYPKATAIYKSSDFGKTWQPFQFYSRNCVGYSGRSMKTAVSGGNETEVLCSRPWDRHPFGASIKFHTLGGRPSASHFESSPALQEWVTATDIRVVFLGTDLDHLGHRRVSLSVFFAVSDFQVEGRCKCNGHASRCVSGDNGQLRCVCEHNTTGTDCDHCRNSHQDRPWKRATVSDAHECIECNCNKHSRSCEFDPRLYEIYGRGGRCINCRHNTVGSQCQFCSEGFYQSKHRGDNHPKACRLFDVNLLSGP